MTDIPASVRELDLFLNHIKEFYCFPVSIKPLFGIFLIGE